MCDGRNFYEGGIATPKDENKINEIETQLAIKPKEEIKECSRCKPQIDVLSKDIENARQIFSEIWDLVIKEIPKEYQYRLIEKINRWYSHGQIGKKWPCEHMKYSGKTTHWVFYESADFSMRANDNWIYCPICKAER